MRKISPPPRFDPRSVHPVGSRYTDWTTRPTNDVRQTEIHTAEPLVPEPIAFEIELATEKLKKSQITRY